MENIKADVQKKVTYFDLCKQLRAFFVSHCTKRKETWQLGGGAVSAETKSLVMGTLGTAGNRGDVARVALVPQDLWELVQKIFDPKKSSDAKGRIIKPPQSGSHMAGLANLPTAVAKNFLTKWAKGEIKGKDFLEMAKRYKRQMLVRKAAIVHIRTKGLLAEEEFKQLDFGKEATKGDATAIGWSWGRLKNLFVPQIDNYRLMSYATYEMLKTENMSKVVSLGTRFQQVIEKMMVERTQAVQPVCPQLQPLFFFCCRNASLTLMNF
jgi:hypothetical protein